MIFFLSILSVALAVPTFPISALENAHQSSMDAFSRELQGSPYDNFILSSYAEPLLQTIDKIWTIAYTENNASLFLQRFTDLVKDKTDELVMKMSNRYEECKLPKSKTLKKRQWAIPSKLEARYNAHDPSIKESFTNVITALRDFFSTVARKTGCAGLVSMLGFVLIGSVLIAYMGTFIMFGVSFGKYLLGNNTSSV
jgi:hypothetical protein